MTPEVSRAGTSECPNCMDYYDGDGCQCPPVSPVEADETAAAGCICEDGNGSHANCDVHHPKQTERTVTWETTCADGSQPVPWDTEDEARWYIDNIDARTDCPLGPHSLWRVETTVRREQVTP